MSRPLVPAVMFGLCVASLPLFATGSETVAAPRALQGEGGGKVMCLYLSYGTKKYVCGEPPVSEVKKRCDEKASAERGEEVECECTDDPNYIQGACD